MLPSIGEIGVIPVEIIRPFANQPRKHFDEDALRELADSIAAEGQRTPAWVMPIDGGQYLYELIAGERRWRACKLAGIPTLRCEVRAPETAAEQYVDAVMENFGRKECTSLEAARAVAEVIRLRYGDDAARAGRYSCDDVGKVFARTGWWVSRHLALLRLDPEVLALLEVPQKIPTQVAMALVNIEPAAQKRLAKKIVGEELGFRQALNLIRAEGRRGVKVSPFGNYRDRRQESRLLSSFVESTADRLDGLLDLPLSRWRTIFDSSKREGIRAVLDDMAHLRENLRSLEEALNRIAAEGRTTAA